MTVGESLNLLSALVTDSGARWGEIATGWQEADARAVLEPAPGDPLLHWCGRPKGGSKSTDLAGMSLAWLLTQAPPMTEGYAAASDREQANRLLDKARGLITRTGGLGSIQVQADRIVNTASGARVVALAADVAGSEGLLSPFFVVDELPNWADTPTAKRLWVSVASGLPKWPGARLVVIGHAGSPSHWSFKVFELARDEPEWRLSDIRGPLPWVSESALNMQRKLLMPSDFSRRHLNQWTEAEDTLSSVEDVRAAAVLEGPVPPQRGVDYVVAVDLGSKHDAAVAVIAHAEPVEGEWVDGEQRVERQRVVVDRLMRWQGSRLRPVSFDVVEDWLVQAAESYRPRRMLLDPWQALGMLQRLRGRGVPAEEWAFTQASVGRLAQTLFGLLGQRLLHIPNDEHLIDELSHVRLRETAPGIVRMDHDSGRHDDQAIAIALASVGLLERPQYAEVVMQSYLGGGGGHLDFEERVRRRQLGLPVPGRGDPRLQGRR